jgi:acetolactate synthase-1/2/3 large subunit
MHNIFRSRLPVLLMAGKAPYTTGNELVGSRDTYVHFVQEPFDQASLVRPYLKWEWTLPSGIVVKEALRRAHSIMQSDPQGPVYLMMQRETLTQPWSVDDVRSFDADQHGSTAGGGADPKLVSQLVDRLLAAKSSDPDHRLCRPQSARVRIDHGAGRVRRHRRVRVEHDQ